VKRQGQENGVMKIIEMVTLKLLSEVDEVRRACFAGIDNNTLLIDL